MKILVTSPDAIESSSGISTVIRFQRKFLEKKGHKLHIISRNTGVTDSHSIKHSGILGTIPFWQKAIRYVSMFGQEYDLVWWHSPLLIKNIWLEGQTKAPIHVITFHSTYLGQYEAFKKHGLFKLLPYYWLASKLERNFLAQIAQKSTLHNTIFTAVSPTVKEELRRNGLRKKIRVIPNGESSDPRLKISKSYARKIMRDCYSINVTDDDLILLFVGRLTEVKQPHLIVNVFKNIMKYNDTLHLVLVGSGNLKKGIQREVSKHPQIHVVGNVPHDKIWGFYFGADAFISLSCYEGNPVSVLEAISAKLPLILSDIPAHRWLIESKMGKGVTINSRNPDSSKITRFLNHTSLSEQFPFHKQFSWEKSCSQYLGSIKELRVSKMAN